MSKVSKFTFSQKSMKELWTEAKQAGIKGMKDEADKNDDYHLLHTVGTDLCQIDHVNHIKISDDTDKFIRFLKKNNIGHMYHNGYHAISYSDIVRDSDEFGGMVYSEYQYICMDHVSKELNKYGIKTSKPRLF